MKINELEPNKKYVNEDGAAFVFNHCGEFYFWNENKEDWEYATQHYSMKELIDFDYHEYIEPIEYTDEEKEIAKICLAMGFQALVRDKDCGCYCIDTKKIKINDYGQWEYTTEEIHYWVEVEVLPKLANSTLLEKVTKDQPIFFEDIIN